MTDTTSRDFQNPNALSAAGVVKSPAERRNQTTNYQRNVAQRASAPTLLHGHTHRRRRHSERALWPDTTMASAFLIALTKWAIAHHNDADAKITLSVGVVGAEELMNVLHALEKARQRTGYVASPHPND